MTSAPERIGQFQLGGPFGTLGMVELAYFHNHPEHPLMMGEKVECSQGCGTEIWAPRLTSAITACKPCIDAAKERDRIAANRAYWEAIAPESIRETDVNHAGFPAAQYLALKDYEGERSLLFLGPTGAGKTRLAFTLLKRCLHRKQMRIGVMWDEDLASTKRGFGDRNELIGRWSKYDLLLIDDGLMTGSRDEQVTSFLKSLLDAQNRKNHRVIITSQLTAADYQEELNKTKSTAADNARQGAVLSRIREMCGDPVIFHPAKVDDAARPF